MDNTSENDAADMEDLDDYEKWALSSIEESIAVFVAKYGLESLPDDDVLFETALKRLHTTISDAGTATLDKWQAFIPKATRIKNATTKNLVHIFSKFGESHFFNLNYL